MEGSWICDCGYLTSKTSTAQIGLGKKLLTFGKIVKLIVIILLILVGLSGSECIFSKKRAEFAATWR